ncbi:MAG: hypothetical protein ABSC17_05670 [Thermacetogeniaceae bacterium]
MFRSVDSDRSKSSSTSPSTIKIGFIGPLTDYIAIDWATMDDGYFTNHYSADDPDPLVQNWVKDYQTAYGSVPDAMATSGL